MSGNASEVGMISDVIARLRANASKEILTALAREATNHVFLVAQFGLSANGELKARDIEMIIDRWELVLRTIQPSGPGHEQFRPPSERPQAFRPRAMPDLDRLEASLRTPPPPMAEPQTRRG